MKKKNWYCEENKKDQYSNKPTPAHRKKKRKVMLEERVKTTTVVFIPSTKGRLLVMRMREHENKLSQLPGFRVKYQEAGGGQLANSFSTDTGKGEHCGGLACPPCNSTVDSKKRLNCKAKNLVYENICLVCNPETRNGSRRVEKESRRGIYLGETSRSLHERSIEHLRDAVIFSSKSHLVKHGANKHPELNS